MVASVLQMRETELSPIQLQDLFEKEIWKSESMFLKCLNKCTLLRNSIMGASMNLKFLQNLKEAVLF